MLNICWFLWISCWIYVDHGCSMGPPTNTKRFDHFPTMAGKWKSMENSDQNDEQYVETCHAKIPSRQDFRMRSRAIYFARTRWISGWWFQYSLEMIISGRAKRCVKPPTRYWLEIVDIYAARIFRPVAFFPVSASLRGSMESNGAKQRFLGTRIWDLQRGCCWTCSRCIPQQRESHPAVMLQGSFAAWNSTSFPQWISWLRWTVSTAQPPDVALK